MTSGQLEAAAELSPRAAAAALDELEWGRWLASDARGYGLVARIGGEIIARDLVTPGHRRRIGAARAGA